MNGDEIVFVLEQADERKAGQCNPGCLQVTGKAGTLTVAGFESFRRVRPKPERDVSLAEIYEPDMATGADTVQPCACR